MTDPICSFCGKARREVKKLVSGPNVYICDECIGLCNDILAEEVQKQLATDVEKPHALLASLDEQVVGHSAAKRTLAAAARQQHALPDAALRILLVGPSGSGKTTLGRALTSSVPNGYATDVGRLSETGYVGDDVEHVLCGLLDFVEGSIERAERGTVFLDGIEKLAFARPLTRARDISGESVQRELLRFFDGTRVFLPKGGGARHPQQANQPLETKRILIVAAVRMEGWTLPPGSSERVLRDVLAEHGLLGAFVARFDRVLQLSPPTLPELREIARRLVGDAARKASAVGTNLTVSPSALDMLAAAADKADDGGWALRAPIHRLVEDVMLATTAEPSRTIDDAAMKLVLR